MINILTIGSSSKGNCYQLDNGNSRLMVECGLPWMKTKKRLNFNTSGIKGVLVSHEHGDHSKAVQDAAKAGLDVYLSKGTAEAIKANGHRIHHIRSLHQFNVQEWLILPFDTVHDAAEPLGFLIQSGDDKLLFLTDSAYCKYKFTGITHLMIECNFSNEILDKNITSGSVHISRKKRLLESHFSLDRLKDFLRENDTTRLQEIHLLHLSDENSNEAQFLNEIQVASGVPVYIAKA